MTSIRLKNINCNINLDYWHISLKYISIYYIYYQNYQFRFQQSVWLLFHACIMVCTEVVYCPGTEPEMKTVCRENDSVGVAVILGRLGSSLGSGSEDRTISLSDLTLSTKASSLMFLIPSIPWSVSKYFLSIWKLSRYCKISAASGFGDLGFSSVLNCAASVGWLSSTCLVSSTCIVLHVGVGVITRVLVWVEVMVVVCKALRYIKQWVLS